MPKMPSSKTIKVGDRIYRNGNMHRIGIVARVRRVCSNGRHRTMLTVRTGQNGSSRTEIWNLEHCRYPDW